MKIALFTETYLPYINGVVTHVKILREGLTKLGHEVLVVCANPNTKSYYLKDGVLNCPGVSFKKVYNYGIATPISPIRFRYIKNFNPDVIHIHNEFGVGYSGAAAAKNLDIPLIYTLHTMYDDYLYYIAPRHLIKLAKKSAHAYAKMLGERATCLTGPSKKVEAFFRSCGVDKPVHIIPNPVETDLFTPKCIQEDQRKQIREKWNVQPDEMLLCFCGRLGKEKSVDVLLKYWSSTVRKQDRYKLLIIGDGPVKTELQALTKQLHLTDRIIFAGKVDHNQLPPYYAACDLYITASISDTNSISMLEAMATGLPVLHICDELNRGQVIDGVNGFVYQNPEQMHYQMMKYQKMDQEQKQLLKSASRKSVLSSGAETLANNLLKVYQESMSIHKNHLQKKKGTQKIS